LLQETLAIINKLGLHARATAKLVRLSQQYQCQITVAYNGLSADGKSIMGLMMLAAAQGSKLVFTFDGIDEKECYHAVKTLLAHSFGEES